MNAFDFDSDFVPLPEPTTREKLLTTVSRFFHWLGLKKKDQVPRG